MGDVKWKHKEQNSVASDCIKRTILSKIVLINGDIM